MEGRVTQIKYLFMQERERKREREEEEEEKEEEEEIYFFGSSKITSDMGVRGNNIMQQIIRSKTYQFETLKILKC